MYIKLARLFTIYKIRKCYIYNDRFCFLQEPLFSSVSHFVKEEEEKKNGSVEQSQ